MFDLQPPLGGRECDARGKANLPFCSLETQTRRAQWLHARPRKHRRRRHRPHARHRPEGRPTKPKTATLATSKTAAASKTPARRAADKPKAATSAPKPASMTGPLPPVVTLKHLAEWAGHDQ